MVDNKPINNQIHKFQNMIQEIHRGGETKLDENYQVTCLIDKLPPSWSLFAQSLRKTQTKLDLRSIIQSIRIEDQFRLRQIEENQLSSKVNLTETKNYNNNSNNNNNNNNSTYNKNKNFKNKNKSYKSQVRNGNFKNNKIQNNKRKEFSRPNNEKKKLDNNHFCYVCG